MELSEGSGYGTSIARPLFLTLSDKMFFVPLICFALANDFAWNRQTLSIAYFISAFPFKKDCLFELRRAFSKTSGKMPLYFVCV